jgi:hypothetical protein
MSAQEPSDHAPDPARAQRTTRRLLWACVVLSAFVGVFLVADVVRSSPEYGVPAWFGVVLSGLSIAGLIVGYAACALGRLTLNQPVIGKLTVFHLSTVGLVVAIGADILIPDRDTGGLALLLPWGIAYWLHHLNAATSDGP